MAFFDSFDIIDLETKRREKLNENFEKKYADEIEHELKWMAARIRQLKPVIMLDMVNAVGTRKSTEVSVITIDSFDFSKMHGGEVIYNGWSGTQSYKQVAIQSRKGSFVNVGDDKYVSRFQIWKTRYFVDKLAEMLELPPNARFVVRSVEKDHESHTNMVFKGHKDVREFETSMYLVYNFAK
jgi:hypothetical protein